MRMRDTRRSGSYAAFKIMLALLAAALAFPLTAFSAGGEIRTDTENCLICHRYPGMGRFDEAGVKRIYYINEMKFANSVHGKLKCTNCHVGLDKIPHTDIRKVDCTTQCHLKEPSTEREFSHTNMVEKYNHSVHGNSDPNNPKPFPEDLPTCTYCHDNSIRSPLEGVWGTSQALANETLSRCVGCHTKDHWAQNYYLHVTHRMRHLRSQAEIIKLCTSCHEDSEKMSRHGLDSIATFKDTFHWNLVKFKVKDAPDCISCHVPIGFTTHDIRPKYDQASSVNKRNRVNTCSNQGGIQSCHPGATDDFAGGRVHAYGTKAQLVVDGAQSIAVEADESLLSERARRDMSEREIMNFKILSYIRLFYKILIPMVIGFMVCHQTLDLLATLRKNRHNSH